MELLPLACADVLFMEREEIVERALEGTLGLRFVTIEFVETVHVLVVPIDDVRFGGVVIEFVFAVDSLHAREAPVRDGGVFDERRLLFGDRLVVTEVFLEHRQEGFGIFAGDEELLGSGAVLEAIETGLGRRGIECGCCCCHCDLTFQLEFGMRRAGWVGKVGLSY